MPGDPARDRAHLATADRPAATERLPRFAGDPRVARRHGGGDRRAGTGETGSARMVRRRGFISDDGRVAVGFRRHADRFRTGDWGGTLVPGVPGARARRPLRTRRRHFSDFVLLRVGPRRPATRRRGVFDRHRAAPGVSGVGVALDPDAHAYPEQYGEHPGVAKSGTDVPRRDGRRDPVDGLHGGGCAAGSRRVGILSDSRSRNGKAWGGSGRPVVLASTGLQTEAAAEPASPATVRPDAVGWVVPPAAACLFVGFTIRAAVEYNR
jgi:hypothetical protein